MRSQRWGVAGFLAAFAAAGCVAILGLGEPTVDGLGPDAGSGVGHGGGGTAGGTFADASLATGGASGSGLADGAGSVHVDGGMPLSCAGGLTACGTSCVNVQTDVSNCGSCSQACAAGDACFAGQCCSKPAAGGTCNLPACGCEQGRVCFTSTSTTGLSCVVGNGVREGEDCTGVGRVCAVGLGCFGDTCRRYCTSDMDCPSVDGAQRCNQTTRATGENIPGVLVCSRVCDPVSPQTPHSPLLSCPAGFGCKAAPVPGASNCLKQPGTGAAGSACMDATGCLPGHYCAVSSLCFKYCYTVDDCAAGSTCMVFAVSLFAGTREVGFCTRPSPTSDAGTD